MVDHLITSFRKLRARKMWQHCVRGGCYVIEVTHSDHGWHAHLHILAMSRFMPQRWLSNVWNSISGSPIVWIESCRKGNNPVAYVTSYMTTWNIPQERLAEANRDLRDRRLWNVFGVAHAWNLKYRPAHTPCPCCGSDSWISDREREFRLLHWASSG